MPRYVISNDQLIELQNQIRQLKKQNEAKEERIRNFEKYKIQVSGSENSNLITTIGKLEGEIQELRHINNQLINSKNENLKEIKELEILLQEERKLREYTENFAKQVELRCAEESLIRELTNELCQLQKDEIEIENKHINDLKRKIKKLSKEIDYLQMTNEKEINKHSKTDTKENTIKDFHLKAVANKLNNHLAELHEQFSLNQSTNDDEIKQRQTLDLWMREMGELMEELRDAQEIRKDLIHLKKAIEDKRKSVASSENEF